MNIETEGTVVSKEKLVEFIRSMPTVYPQERSGGPPHGKNPKKLLERLKLADDYYKRCEECKEAGEKELSYPEYCEYCEEDGRKVSVRTLGRATAEYAAFSHAESVESYCKERNVRKPWDDLSEFHKQIKSRSKNGF
jgi:recombinational DNA repair protein RecR